MSKEWFSELEFILGKDAVKTFVTKDLEYYINLLDKAAAGFERIDSSFERSSPLGQMLLNSIAGCREVIHKRKS